MSCERMGIMFIIWLRIQAVLVVLGDNSGAWLSGESKSNALTNNSKIHGTAVRGTHSYIIYTAIEREHQCKMSTGWWIRRCTLVFCVVWHHQRQGTSTSFHFSCIYFSPHFHSACMYYYGNNHEFHSRFHKMCNIIVACIFWDTVVVIHST